jgi:hypothetical protein
MQTITSATQPTKTAEQIYLEELPDFSVGTLPYWPIWAAAQFASTEESKPLLNFVHIFRDKDAFQIQSTDGHRAFRYRLPAWKVDCWPTAWSIPDNGLLLHAAPLKKAVSLGKIITVSKDLRLYIHGGRKNAVLELASYNLSGFHAVNTANDVERYEYPKINQLWPKEFDNAISKPFSFNARHLKEWFAVVEKLSPNCVTKVQGNTPVSPFVFSCVYEAGEGHYTDATLECLVMPVQVRG